MIVLEHHSAVSKPELLQRHSAVGVPQPSGENDSTNHNTQVEWPHHCRWRTGQSAIPVRSGRRQQSDDPNAKCHRAPTNPIPLRDQETGAH